MLLPSIFRRTREGRVESFSLIALDSNSFYLTFLLVAAFPPDPQGYSYSLLHSHLSSPSYYMCIQVSLMLARTATVSTITTCERPSGWSWALGNSWTGVLFSLLPSIVSSWATGFHKIQGVSSCGLQFVTESRVAEVFLSLPFPFPLILQFRKEVVYGMSADMSTKGILLFSIFHLSFSA